MPTYQYEALDAGGKPQKGVVDASSSDDAIQQIRSQGFFPTAVRQQNVKGGDVDAGGGKGKKKKAPKAKKKGAKKGEINIPNPFPIKQKKITQFTRQLSTLQDAGLPLLRSLQILEMQQKHGKFKGIISSIVEDVEAGSTLSDSMAKHPKAFNRLYSKMVNAGEIGGVIDLILQRLANFMEKAQRLKAKIKGAMIYPVVVLVIAVVIVTGIMYFVIPKFQDIFNDFEVELPKLTTALINMSSWVAGNNPGQSIPGYAVIVAFPFLVVAFFVLVRKTNFGRAAVDWTLLKIPVLGNLVEKTSVARFTRTLGTLISAGVPILEAINITRETAGNWVYERALTRVHDSIREGETFAEPLRESKVCDSLVVNMIDVGEETGDLDVMLMKVADNYDEEVDVAVQALLSLLEPMLVVVLGLVVGTIVLALFLPLVSMIESVSAN